MIRVLALALLLGGCKRARLDCHLDARLAYAHPLPAGARVTFADLRQRSFREDGTARGLTPFEAERAIGRFTRRPVAENAPVLEEELDERLFVAKQLRAVRVESDFALKLEAGELVDVLAAARDEAATVVHAARVLKAADGEVWLEVLPEEAELVLLARAPLTLTRRAPGDCDAAPGYGATVRTLLTGERRRLVTRRHPCPIQIIR